MWTAPSCDSSQRSPYGNPLPGAGAVHHIRSGHWRLLFYYIVGTQEERWRNRHTDGVCGLQVHDQFELGGDPAIPVMKSCRRMPFSKPKTAEMECAIAIKSGILAQRNWVQWSGCVPAIQSRACLLGQKARYGCLSRSLT